MLTLIALAVLSLPAEAQTRSAHATEIEVEQLARHLQRARTNSPTRVLVAFQGELALDALVRANDRTQGQQIVATELAEWSMPIPETKTLLSARDLTCGFAVSETTRGLKVREVGDCGPSRRAGRRIAQREEGTLLARKYTLWDVFFAAWF